MDTLILKDGQKNNAGQPSETPSASQCSNGSAGRSSWLSLRRRIADVDLDVFIEALSDAHEEYTAGKLKPGSEDHLIYEFYRNKLIRCVKEAYRSNSKENVDLHKFAFGDEFILGSYTRFRKESSVNKKEIRQMIAEKRKREQKGQR